VLKLQCHGFAVNEISLRRPNWPKKIKIIKIEFKATPYLVNPKGIQSQKNQVVDIFPEAIKSLTRSQLFPQTNVTKRWLRLERQ